VKGKANQLVRYLSGGNQQKVIIARWISRGPKVFILDEPTRGIDMGARAAIYETITSLAKSGMAVIVVSSDLEEVMGLSHRVLVLARGRNMGILEGSEVTNVAIMELVEGPVSFVDTRNNKRDGKALLKPVQTVINGVPFGRPYQSPFAVR